jgi:hypothetical protein
MALNYDLAKKSGMMRHIKGLWVTTALGIHCVFWSPCTAQSHSGMTVEVVNAWKGVRDTFQDGFHFEYVMYDVTKGESSERGEVDSGSIAYKVSPEGFTYVVLLCDAGSPTTGQAFARNDDYSFELTRIGNANKWFMKDLMPSQMGGRHLLSNIIPQFESNMVLVPWSEKLGEGLFERILDETLTLTAAPDSEVGGRILSVCQCTLDGIAPGETGNRTVKRTISFYLDPDNAYLPVRITDVMSDAWQKTIEFSDFRPVRNVQIPHRFTSILESNSVKTPEYSYENNVTRFIPGSVNASESRLPAFGISEPDFVQTGSTKPVLLIGIGLIAAVVIAGVLQWISRARSRARTI